MSDLLLLGIFPFDMIRPQELVIVLIIAVILFGKRLPELGRMVGRTLVNFKHGVNEMKDEINKPTTEAPAAKDTAEEPAQTSTPADPVVSSTEQATPPAEDRRNDSMLPE